MSDGTIVIAGPGVAQIVTKLQIDRSPPPNLKVTYSEPGRVREVRNALIASPPPTPFVAIVFGKNASFRTRVTEHPSSIFLCGPDAIEIDRLYLDRILALTNKVGPKGVPLGVEGVLDMIALRHRLARDDYRNVDRGDADRLSDQEQFRQVRQAGLLSLQEFMTLPAPLSPLTTFLRQMEV